MRRVPATTAWLVYRAGFGGALYLGVTTFTLSLIDRADAGPLTLALVGTTLEVAYTLAEVPTGVLADRYGRRRSIVIGLVLVGAGLGLTAVAVLPVVIAAQVLVAVGWTCTSGADIAWITDEVGEDAARPLYASGARADLLGSVAGITAGALLGQAALWVPLVAAAVAFALLAGWLALRMPETAPVRTHEDRLTMVETVRRTRSAVRARPWMAVVLAMMLVVGLGGEGVDRLWQFHLVGDGAGEASIVFVVAAIFIASLLLGAAGATVVERRAGDDPDLPRRWLTAANAAVAVAVVGLAVAPWPVAVAALVVSGALRHASLPLVQAWVNRGADPATRATFNSLVGQAESVGEIAGGPLLGGIGALAGVPRALLVSAGMFGAAGLLTRRPLLPLHGRRHRRVVAGHGGGGAAVEQPAES